MTMVGMVAVNSLVAGNNKVPITSKIMAPSNARYEDMLFIYCSVKKLKYFETFSLAFSLMSI